MLELLSIDLSNYCTKQCPFCYNHSTKEGNVMWKPEEVISFAMDCVAHGIKAVSLGGGEPFEYEGLIEIIDALYPICYLSITTNGLPLEQDQGKWWKLLKEHHPDKIHITLHNADSKREFNRVSNQIRRLDKLYPDIKAGCNILVSASKIEACREAYRLLTRNYCVSPDRIILVPRRFGDTPIPIEVSRVADWRPFQSPTCLNSCERPDNFVSVSWDKKVNFCSYAGGKQPLETLDYDGLMKALSKVEFKSCLNHED